MIMTDDNDYDKNIPQEEVKGEEKYCMTYGAFRKFVIRPITKKNKYNSDVN